MEEIQSLVDISHIVPPMKMGKAAVCGYRRYRYGAATHSVASPARRWDQVRPVLTHLA
jgi:hypothetical protein